MTTAECLRELRQLAGVFRQAGDSADLRLAVATAAEVFATGVDPVIELRLRLLRRRAAMRLSPAP